MVRYVKKTIVEATPSHLICDYCDRTIDLSNDPDLEAQEFLMYRSTGGYSSVFGDGSSIELDLCQHCVNKLFGNVIRSKIKEEIND